LQIKVVEWCEFSKKINWNMCLMQTATCSYNCLVSIVLFRHSHKQEYISDLSGCNCIELSGIWICTHRWKAEDKHLRLEVVLSTLESGSLVPLSRLMCLQMAPGCVHDLLAARSLPGSCAGPGHPSMEATSQGPSWPYWIPVVGAWLCPHLTVWKQHKEDTWIVQLGRDLCFSSTSCHPKQLKYGWMLE